MAKSWLSLLASSCSALWLQLQLLLLLFIIYNVDYARADYENTWNLYYEPPCCTGAAAAVGHHLRHHKGKSQCLYTMHISCCNFSLSKCSSGFSLTPFTAALSATISRNLAKLNACWQLSSSLGYTQQCTVAGRESVGEGGREAKPNRSRVNKSTA